MKSDSCNFQKLINDQIRDMEESQILLNYNLFMDLIRESDLSPEEIYQGIQKLEIVYIQLTKENPQLIFESLNSTGLDLTQADLIRNYLLMGQAYEKQEELYNNYWIKLEKMLPDAMISDYIRDYLTLKTGIIPVDSWRSFLKNICMQVYEYDAQIFRSLIRHKDFKGKSKRLISDTDENMRVPQKIAEGIYLEMNLSANEALNYAKLVIDKYEGMENECSSKLKPLH